MTPKSITEVYRLSDMRGGFRHPIIPYDLGVVANGEPRSRVFLFFDCDDGEGRIDLGPDIIRDTTKCTHLKFGVFEENEKPVDIGFGAVCLQEVYNEKTKEFQRVREDLRPVAEEIFDPLCAASRHEIIIRPSLRKRLKTKVPAIVSREEGRFFDACMSKVITKEQAQELKRFIIEIEENPGMYALWGGLNCSDVAKAGLRRAGISMHPCADNMASRVISLRRTLSYPKWEVESLQEICRDKSTGQFRMTERDGWDLQPTQVTAQMALLARERLVQTTTLNC